MTNNSITVASIVRQYDYMLCACEYACRNHDLGASIKAYDECKGALRIMLRCEVLSIDDMLDMTVQLDGVFCRYFKKHRCMYD